LNGTPTLSPPPPPPTTHPKPAAAYATSPLHSGEGPGVGLNGTPTLPPPPSPPTTHPKPFAAYTTSPLHSREGPGVGLNGTPTLPPPPIPPTTHSKPFAVYVTSPLHSLLRVSLGVRLSIAFSLNCLLSRGVHYVTPPFEGGAGGGAKKENRARIPDMAENCTFRGKQVLSNIFTP